MVFNDYVEKTEHGTLISDVNVNVTFSKTKKDMNIKKKQHSTYFTDFSKKANLNQELQVNMMLLKVYFNL